MQKPVNKEKRYLLISLLVGLLGGIAMVAPFIFPIDINDGGGAMIVVGLLFLITGPIVALLFWSRSSAFDKLLDESKLLAHWQYNVAEWKEFAKNEYEYRKGENIGLFILVVVICLIVGGIFWIADPETGPLIMGVMVGLIILIAAVAYFVTRSYAGWEKNTEVEARIGSHGLIINQQFHVWEGWGNKLEEIKNITGKLNILEITYSSPNRYSRQYFTVRVLVPADKEQDAINLQNKLKQNIKS